mmetsp:Transcript_79709/g.221703  ORF Transcript_79709/g.221703 Transcript_79709/m.221703 type:complete len:203 (-) Transcript_79709:64-672(-)
MLLERHIFNIFNIFEDSPEFRGHRLPAEAPTGGGRPSPGNGTAASSVAWRSEQVGELAPGVSTASALGGRRGRSRRTGGRGASRPLGDPRSRRQRPASGSRLEAAGGEGPARLPAPLLEVDGRPRPTPRRRVDHVLHLAVAVGEVQGRALLAGGVRAHPPEPHAPVAPEHAPGPELHPTTGGSFVRPRARPTLPVCSDKPRP